MSILLGARLDLDLIGRAFGEHEIADAVERVVDVYLQERAPGERFLDTYRRVGLARFKTAAYEKPIFEKTVA